MLKRQFDSSVSNRNLPIIGRLCFHQFDSISGIRLRIPIQFRNRGICISAVDSDTTFSPQSSPQKWLGMPSLHPFVSRFNCIHASGLLVALIYMDAYNA